MRSLDGAQPFATARNFPRGSHMAMPIGSSVIFGRFTCHLASFRVAGMTLPGMWTCCLVTCRKSSRVAGALLSRRFQNMCCTLRGWRSTLDVSTFMFRGRRITSDVSCCVVCGNHVGRTARSGDKVQILRQAWHFVRCVEIWR